MPNLREFFWFSEVSVLCQAADDGMDLRKMDGGGLADRGTFRRFQQNIDEGAAFERLLVKPPIKDIEDRQKPALRRFRAAFDLRLKPAAGPDRLALIKKCDRKLNLGLEVAVKT